MPCKVEKLAREIVSDPIRVTIGEHGMIDEGDVLVFASKKATVDEIESQLSDKGFKNGSAGDKDGIAYTLITQVEAQFAGELVQNVSMELMDLAMKDGRFRSKRDARKGGGKKVRGRGGSGRGARGVDYGLGIGFNPQSSNFVAASSNSQSQGFSGS
ncbi:hypothetical protein V6N13_079267 [Hibiscus sabdariffa]|uniref:Uncharacterized protein n=1 Tax=Hibiscus sabdariffa TaxID=183260 RepID=A0ABR2RR77_9ROSI